MIHPAPPHYFLHVVNTLIVCMLTVFPDSVIPSSLSFGRILDLLYVQYFKEPMDEDTWRFIYPRYWKRLLVFCVPRELLKIDAIVCSYCHYHVDISTSPSSCNSYRGVARILKRGFPCMDSRLLTQGYGGKAPSC